MSRLALPLLLLLLAAVPPRIEAQSEDEGQLREAVTALLDAMRAGDADGVREAFMGGARLQTVTVGVSGAGLRDEEVEEFARAVGSPREQVWDERIDAWRIHVDGDLAVVTTDYSFYLDDRFSHCGMNAFLLLRTSEGWKIFQLVDTRRRTGCASGG
jgi:ketosteroid isomerase-like protein